MFGKYVKQYGTPDIIHAHCGKNAGIAATEIGKATGCPVFITEHLSKSLFEKDFGVGWTRQCWMKDLIARAYKDAACVIPVAEELVSELSPYFGCDYNYVPVSNVIDVDFYAYRDRSPLEGRAFRFCCLGNANGEGLFLKQFALEAGKAYLRYKAGAMLMKSDNSITLDANTITFKCSAGTATVADIIAHMRTHNS